jgi:hypothetical protein
MCQVLPKRFIALFGIDTNDTTPQRAYGISTGKRTQRVKRAGLATALGQRAQNLAAKYASEMRHAVRKREPILGETRRTGCQGLVRECEDLHLRRNLKQGGIATIDGSINARTRGLATFAAATGYHNCSATGLPDCLR